MRYRLEITELDNAAFEGNPGAEVARILRNAAHRLEARGLEPDTTLRDVNGNTVGFTTTNKGNSEEVQPNAPKAHKYVAIDEEGHRYFRTTHREYTHCIVCHYLDGRNEAVHWCGSQALAQKSLRVAVDYPGVQSAEMVEVARPA